MTFGKGRGPQHSIGSSRKLVLFALARMALRASLNRPCKARTWPGGAWAARGRVSGCAVGTLPLVLRVPGLSDPGKARPAGSGGLGGGAVQAAAELLPGWLQCGGAAAGCRAAHLKGRDERADSDSPAAAP